MKRRDFINISAVLASGTLWGGKVSALPANSFFDSELMPIQRFGDGRDWFFEKRFGMFVHWGIYAIPAVHEQYQQRYSISREEYDKYAQQWNPKDFNPDHWLDLMQEAGMEYLTFTTKHHDGFCMWDTKETSFNVMNTPYNKDILGMLANACYKRNVPLCLYYSVVDWHNPYYPNKGRHHELPQPEPGDTPNWEKYMEFVKAQVKELCTNYGEISGFWWDMNVPEYKDPSINAMIRKLQPNAVINNRGFDKGDYGTPERNFDKGADKVMEFDRPVEACESAGMQSWGYRKNEDYYTDRYLEKKLDNYLSKNGNFLLNVGPDATGKIPEVPTGKLKRLGKWYHSVQEAYENVELIPGLSSNNMLVTAHDNIMYVHLNTLPVGNTVGLYPLSTMPEKAILLNNNKKLSCSVKRKPYEKEPFLWINELPVNELCNTVPVVKLEFKKSINKLLS